MKHLVLISICSFLMTGVFAQKFSLEGQWKVQLGSTEGREYSIQLPGTLDDAGIGDTVNIVPGLNIATLAHLTRKVQYTGKAYYSRELFIPKHLQGGTYILKLGRVLWKSSITIDGTLLPVSQESLVASHEYDITPYIRPGYPQRITICIDNSNIYPGINIYAPQYPSKESIEMTHAYTNHTQIKWNGVLGEISVIRRPKVYIKQTTIKTDSLNQWINLNYEIANSAGKRYSVTGYVQDRKKHKKWLSGFKKSVMAGTKFNSRIAIPKEVVSWSEFSPDIFQLVTIVKSESGTDTTFTDFGIRDLAVKKADLYLNGKKLFVRGNLECIIFPLKGYPPMEVGEWVELFRKAKSYGLNTFRFHSWCPPEAAFIAADKTGFYLHVELPHWHLKVGADSAAFNFLKQEAFTILSKYGNHPSFLFFSMGNELEGDFSKLNQLVYDLKATDNRHLYSTTTFTLQKDIIGAAQPADDFFVTQSTRSGWIRGQGIFNDQSPDFTRDYSKAMKNIQVPLISHEIGQYSVYPDMQEIKEYTGNLKPLNFIAVQQDLQAKGMSYLAPHFLEASGKLAALLYKEEIEMSLRTTGMDGFHLLQLQDFPGQGTALVGLVNAFWKNKGFITPDWFHRFCSEVTPLIRFQKAVYSTHEDFSATVELANFHRPLVQQSIYWRIKNSSNDILGSGRFPKADFAVGNGLQAGIINFPLSKINRASQLTIEVGLAGTSYRNEWKIWVYPDEPVTMNPDILATTNVDSAMIALEQGRNVLLCAHPDSLNGIPGKFVPIFWSPIHFPDQPGTMGLLIKNDHAALRDFPTDLHTDWQWWDLVTKSRSLLVRDIPEQAIIIRVIDNFVRNQPLSVLFEGKVGKGKLLVCSIDLNSDVDKRIAARQLKISLLNYMGSQDFAPAVQLNEEVIRRFFK